ncbi:hypothetical protein B0T17DRAFT_506315 [Bombardia bombarda]|uniref:Uncharacterized protein n=1 Tax=Bombardia bombarda TaxID=252184 RepID=A0AA39X9G6_9PEZI|nr:hypothetical protein B0T17DRAFT_506315 [Bombardia bombarda]
MHLIEATETVLGLLCMSATTASISSYNDKCARMCSTDEDGSARRPRPHSSQPTARGRGTMLFWDGMKLLPCREKRRTGQGVDDGGWWGMKDACPGSTRGNRRRGNHSPRLSFTSTPSGANVGSAFKWLPCPALAAMAFTSHGSERRDKPRPPNLEEDTTAAATGRLPASLQACKSQRYYRAYLTAVPGAKTYEKLTAQRGRALMIPRPHLSELSHPVPLTHRLWPVTWDRWPVDRRSWTVQRQPRWRAGVVGIPLCSSSLQCKQETDLSHAFPPSSQKSTFKRRRRQPLNGAGPRVDNPT